MSDLAPITYCSFADDEEGFRGVLILDGHLDPMAASLTARMLGLNPGGQLLTVTVSAGAIPTEEHEAMLANRGRLLNAEECRRLLGGKSLREWEENPPP